MATIDLTEVVLQAKDFDEHSLKALRLRNCEIAEEDLEWGRECSKAAGGDHQDAQEAHSGAQLTLLALSSHELNK